MKRYMLIWAVISGILLTINNTGYAQVTNNTYVPNSVNIDKTSKAVGEIPFTTAVAPTGAVTYNVPIEVYPGIHGMQPQLAIGYNSMAGNGIMGVGWNIGGLSSIGRGNRSMYYDGTPQGISMTKADAFYLDGMRLIKLSETTSQIKYESEQGNIKATANLNGNIVKYFDVFYPNGTKGTYGSTNSSASYLEYPLTAISDLYGNTITYTYTYVDNHYRIDKISYANASVEFQYQTASRLDVITSYNGGLKVKEDKLLQKIVCKYGSTVLRNYDFTYKTTLREAQLSQIDYSAANGTAFNPLKFYYGENSIYNVIDSNNINVTKITSNYHTWTNPNDIKVTQGKFGNEADDGLIVLPDKIPYKQSSSSSFSNEYAGTEKIYMYSGLGGSYLSTKSVTTESGFIDIFCANIDGKDKEEVIKVNNVVSGSNDRIIFNIYSASNPSWYEYMRTFDLPKVAGLNSIQPKYYFTGDFNGDGKTEILAVSCHQPFGLTSCPTKCYLFDLESNTKLYEDSPFTYNVTFGNTQSAINNTDRLFVLDYDGDGKSDICLINSSGTYIYSFNISGSTYSLSQVASYTALKRADLADKILMVGEFNGDGKSDFLLSPKVNESDWYIYYSMGNGQFEKVANNVTAIRNSDSRYFLQDIDSDGMPDLIEYTSIGFYVYRTLGYGTISMQYFQPFNAATNAILVPASINSGNTFSQLMAIKDNEVAKYTYMRNDTKEKMLTGSVSSLGVVNKNYYRMLYESSGFYTENSSAVYSYEGYPYENLQGPLFVTEAREQYFNGAKNESLTYFYEEAVIHKQGLGFRGFGKISTIDNIRSRTQYQKFDPYNFGVLVEEDSPAAKNIYTYNATDVASNKIAKIRLSNRSAQNKLTGTTVTAVYTYDPYGSPQTETIYYGGEITETTSNSYSNNTNETGYLLGFLYDRTKTVNRNGSTWSERYYVPAYSNGQPNVVIRYANGNQVSQETFVYDTKGNTTMHGVTPYSSANTLTTDYTYDNYGRIDSKTDPIRLKTTYEYNPDGNLAGVKNHKNQSTDYAHDNFGRQTSVSYPDGTSESVVFSWTAGGTNGLYKVQNTSSTGSATGTYYDALGRETRASQTQFTGAESHTDKLYDSYGRLQKVSLPFTGTAASNWNQYGYDSYDRPTSVTEASGRITSYSYSSNTVTTTKDGISSKQTFDTQGKVSQVSDPGGTITYNLRPDGQPFSTVAPDNVTTSFGYDIYGRRTSITDASAGTQTWTYDSAGNIYTETDANNKTISYGYDSYNRPITKTCPEFTVNYRYNSDGLLRADSINSTLFTTYMYDIYGRPYKVKESAVDGKWLEKTYSYLNGNLSSTQYTSQTGSIVTENYAYAKGALTEIKLNGTTSIWKLNTVNAFEQPTSATTGSFNRTYNYDDYALPTGRTAGSFQNFSYSFDAAKGNLNYRKDNGRNKQEDFAYDNLNRLKTYSEMDNKGNLTYRSDVGKGVHFYYNTSGKPYTMSGVWVHVDGMPLRNQTVTYTSFKRPASITEGEYTAAFTYNGNGNRVKMELKKNGAKDMNRYYLSDCYEIDDKAVGGIKEKLYLGGDFYSAPAVYVKDGSGGWQIYYICRDYLGSITHITNSGGSVVQELSYDAWGRLRNPENQQAYAPDSEPELFLGRGYTGHEHLAQFGLINMNARLYDPALGRFLSPDPFVQAPGFSQNFNRYSYCLNNPLKYSDPNGEIIFTLLAAIFAPPLVPLGAQLDMAWMQGGFMAKMNGGNFWAGAGKGLAISAASSALTFGVGEMFGHTVGSLGTELARAGAHGLVGGGISAIQGDNFWQGFAVGGVSSLAGSGMQGLGWGGGNLPLATGLAGAGTSWAMGGDPMGGFWQGYDIGSLNHNGGKGTYDDPYQLDEVVATAKRPMFVVRGGITYGWSGYGFDRVVGEKGLENVYPEFEVLLTGRLLYNTLSTVAKGGETFFDGAKYSDKVLRQMNKADDIYHAFPRSVDGYATKFGQWSTRVGADGKAYQWLEMPGGYGGKIGTFEYIKDAGGIINHRFFHVP